MVYGDPRLTGLLLACQTGFNMSLMAVVVLLLLSLVHHGVPKGLSSDLSSVFYILMIYVLQQF